MTDAPEQSLDLLDTVFGCFADGTKVSDVPRELWHIYSIKSNLQRLFNSRPRYITSFPAFGFTDIPEIDLRASRNLKKTGDLIRDAILRGEPRVRKAEVYKFLRDERTGAPACLIAVELCCGGTGRFRLTLRGIGGNRLDFVSDRDSEQAEDGGMFG